MDRTERAGYEEGSRTDKLRRRRLDLRPAHPRPVAAGEAVRLADRVRQLERELEESRAQLETLELFSALAAHELLKPLVMNEALATMIAERGGHGLDLETRRDVNTMIRISSRTRLLVDALLMDARGGHEPLQRQAVDVAKVLDDCIETLSAEISARAVRVDVDPMPVVPGDVALLTSVFGNLLVNALQYGPSEGSAIHVSAARSEAGWTFSVEGGGPAIPERDRQRIWEPWQRARGERRARGVGLGLAIVRRVVERYGGHVGVTSPGPAANRFFFTLPA
jgi:signal transduction histidine kinase